MLNIKFLLSDTEMVTFFVQTLLMLILVLSLKACNAKQICNFHPSKANAN